MTELKVRYQWFVHSATPLQIAIFEFKPDQRDPDPTRREILSEEETALLQRVLHETTDLTNMDIFNPNRSKILAGFYHYKRKTPLGQHTSDPPSTGATETKT